MPALRVAVAASGGRDSTALLHCTARLAAGLGIEVVALHVHHGLMPAADAWLAHVRAQCRRWGLAFHGRRLEGKPARGQSVEAWARRERYRALAEMARAAGCGLVLLAHHRRDQAETWLLQALRGAGPAGLSAMPQTAERGSVVWARPWLDQPRSAIDGYVQRHRLRHVEDTSNADPRFARSRLRTQVWPALVQAFPDAELALTQATARAQEAAAVLAEVVAQELPALQNGAALALAPWLALSPARRRLMLRAWLAETLAAPVPETLVHRLAHELPAARAARWPAGAQELRLYRGLLRLAQPASTPTRRGEVGSICLHLDQPGEHPLPAWHGCFIVAPTALGGVAPASLQALQARARQGGEQFRLAARGALRSLKKQYQARAVPAWEREGPLLFNAAGDLVFVPGLGVDARWLAAPGAPQLQLRWVPDGVPEPGGPRQPAG